MKGLLLKEVYMVKSYGRSYLLMMVIFLGVGLLNTSQNLFFLLYPAMLIGMFPITLLSYDEREKWNITCEILPVTRADYVTIKYLIGILMNAALILLYFVLFSARMLVRQDFLWNDILSLISVSATLAFLTPAITLPLMFKLGSEKGRVAYLIIVGTLCAVFTIFAVGMDTSFLQQTFFIALPFRILMPAAALVLFLISRSLSIAVYNKRIL